MDASIIEALTAVERAARLVANGDVTATPKLIRALRELDATRIAAVEMPSGCGTEVTR